MAVATFGTLLLIGIVVTVVAVVRRLRHRQPGGFQAFAVVLVIGIALIVGSFVGLRHAM